MGETNYSYGPEVEAVDANSLATPEGAVESEHASIETLAKPHILDILAANAYKRGDVPLDEFYDLYSFPEQLRKR